MKLAFLGSGNIARAIIGGLISHGTRPSDITAADPVQAALDEVAKLGVNTTTDNPAAIKQADVVLISVKPNIVRALASEIAPTVGARLVVSVAAGITTRSLASWLGDNVPIVRCMPNTPALVQSGITGLFATPGVADEQRALALEVLSSVGSCIWVDEESVLDAVTAVSGSGPAYFFYIMEVMESAARELGLPEDMAHKLVLETALGAARMAAASDEAPEALRLKVTSPGGTTEAALDTLMDNNLNDIFSKAVSKAYHRSIALAAEADAKG